MKVSDDVLRMILDRININQKIQLMRMSRQFQRVLDDLFVLQKKLCLGYSQLETLSCAGNDETHKVNKKDILKFGDHCLGAKHENEVTALWLRPLFRRIYVRLPEALNKHSAFILRMRAIGFGLILLLKKCKNLQVLIITGSLWNPFTPRTGFASLSDVVKSLLAFVPKKLTCLIIETDIDISQELITELTTRRLKHLSLSGELTEDSKKLLKKNNPNLVIKITGI